MQFLKGISHALSFFSIMSIFFLARGAHAFDVNSNRSMKDSLQTKYIVSFSSILLLLSEQNDLRYARLIILLIIVPAIICFSHLSAKTNKEITLAFPRFFNWQSRSTIDYEIAKLRYDQGRDFRGRITRSLERARPGSPLISTLLIEWLVG